MSLPAAVTIVEVGPRDGLQNEARVIEPAVKAGLIGRLADCGLGVIEAGSFVSPKWVPQMADTATVLGLLPRRAGLRYPVLVPNMQGYAAARAAGCTEVAVFAAASESFSRRNINCSVAESLERFRPVCAAAQADGVRVRGYVSCVIDCPYEGAIGPGAVAAVAAALAGMGCQEVSLGDTIGTGTPGRMAAMLEAVAAKVPLSRLAVHCHDTYGQAIANIHEALRLGVTVIDAAVAGLGGCPYAKGATGNVATEDVVYLLNGLGIASGVDIDRLVDAGAYICEALGRPVGSRTGRALLARRAA
ncbi:MAG: hydroxymethylglutaryl-CoA lyase [Thalassobaculales bacterium]